jgi:hypothetical protein
MQRPKEHMEMDTFWAAIDWVHFFNDRGTQGEISFTGIGESTMHPCFSEMLVHTRAQFPKLPIVFSTNGLPTFTEEIAQVCKDNEVRVFISLHRPEMAGRAIELAKKYDIVDCVNAAAATAAFDWAGQVDWFVSAPNIECDYLGKGWGVVLFDGKITTCCLDSENLGIIGDVKNKPGPIFVKPYSLCDKCHMQVP